MSERFAELDDVSEIEEIGERTRVFRGTGTAFLPAPDLLQIERVRVGRMELPLAEKRAYPVDGRQTTQEVEEPLIEVQQRSDGVPVLVRAVISNNGIWPRGGKIYVTAQWREPEDVGPAGYDLDFPGLDKGLVRKLKAHFANADAVRLATDEELLSVKGIGAAALAEIRHCLR